MDSEQFSFSVRFTGNSGKEFHLLDTGHFALEEDGQLIAILIRDFIK
jgi:hypothetical protein